MRVYEIKVYDVNWKKVWDNYFRCYDNQQAELEAERICDDIGGKFWEIQRIR